MKLKDISTTINAQSKIAEPGSKLHIAFITHNQKRYIKLLDKDGGFNQRLNEKRLELALTGDRGEVLYGENNVYLYDREGTKKLNEFGKKLDAEIEEDFEFYMVEYANLTIDEKSKLVTLDSEEIEIVSRFISNIPVG